MATCNKRKAGFRHLPRAVALLMVGAAALAAAQDRPESLLPPGFGQPTAPATPRPTPRGTSTPRVPSGAVASPTPLATPAPSQADPVGALLDSLATPKPSPTPSPSATIDPRTLAEYELPASARRSLALVGPAGPSEGALDSRVFAGADGRVAETLMRRLSAPLPSRWTSILLRRTLAAQMITPRGVNGADFAAERAWLLLRMGEAQVARAVVQSVDTANYTPKLFQVGINALLASSDPAGLCPLADRGSSVTGLGGYRVAQAMCAALAGDGQRGAAILRQVRRQRITDDFDLKLAEKLMGSSAGGRRAVSVDWSGADRLTSWRFGLATATGVSIAPEYLSYVGPQVRGWLATSPAVAATERASVIDQAATMGVLSNAALVDFYSALADDDQASRAQGAIANDLRNAYAGSDESQRLSAIRSLWGSDDRTPYGRLVLTARAVARLPVLSSDRDSDRLIASMLSAGLDRSAARWRGAVKQGGDAWAMIELSDPDQQGQVGYDQVTSYATDGDAWKQRMFFAGLAGLGRLSQSDTERGAQALDVRIGQRNAWTEALDQAVADGQTGMVVVLCAIGMQTSDWRGVPPQALYRIVGALRSVGLDAEARMIAAEAIARA
ncbi:hypothetical protein NZL82_00805 [Sphingomonas sanguinis]|uniref:hypothetical protein n=1 Tax=Sphingomonas sp. LC-1 TaxID=3110957 RepID=UPI0021BA9050|nr:hypothetical protein [Sphingomonas sp. LC-1]MCT8000413.1 hypothetical protein [Sphingomonas sp. LC-1]